MLAVQLEAPYVIVNKESSVKRTTMIHDVMFHIFSTDTFNLKKIKQHFAHLEHFKDMLIDNYITSFLSILNSEMPHAMMDIMMERLAEQYFKMEAIVSSDWLKDFHINHQSYRKVYCNRMVQ